MLSAWKFGSSTPEAALGDSATSGRESLIPPVAVPVHVAGQRVSFSLIEHPLKPDGSPAPDVVLKFDGIVTRAALAGIFGKERLTLKRGNSYWQ